MLSNMLERCLSPLDFEFEEINQGAINGLLAVNSLREVSRNLFLLEVALDPLVHYLPQNILFLL